MPGATIRSIGDMLQDTHQKANIQKMLNLRTKLENIKLDKYGDGQQHMTSSEELLFTLARLNDLVD